METKRIATEVVDFLGTAKITAARLAKEAGVSPVIVSRLKTGARKEVRSSTADSIRDAIRRLRESSPEPTDAA